MTGLLEGRGVLVTGGTGSLGKVLVRRILTGEWGEPLFVRVFSRDEGKQHAMRVRFSREGATETNLAYRAITGSGGLLQFVVGDVRDVGALERAMAGVSVVFNAAALKQVPSCEYFPMEAVRTNVQGAENLARVATANSVEAVIGISTDKACKPVNVMGMTKAIQERVFQEANLTTHRTNFMCVRYGNVLASRGSVIPLFLHQIARGGPVTVTSGDMTRFFLTLDRAVDTVMAALEHGMPGETWIPRVPAARIVDLAHQLIDAIDPEVEIKITEVRPGEKLYEELVSAEEASRTVVHDQDYYVIRSVLPEVRDLTLGESREGFVGPCYTSNDELLSEQEVRELLAKHRLFDGIEEARQELLR